ncbi:hypothetical protein [Rivihabitans pingtungensis]|uniref:hypothetical protein n=1 Tax=Rivihabitans pingtungensis TaxID=1054498 RepID=UPI00235227C6|nr:hypothetical protein [Rivihabitans pingtungensis]MCK6437434.1 hypothetical protein [Rivihabitans pingtungensis]
MFSHLQKNFFSFNGLAAFFAAAGVASAFVTMFVNTAESISIKWLIACVLFSSWIIVILLKIIFDLRDVNDLNLSKTAASVDEFLSLGKKSDAIQAALSEIKSEFESQTVAITATCIAFEYYSRDQCILYLIQNSNFDQWWLAPGGHADLREDEYPDKIASEKCLAEAGLNVKLLPSSVTHAGAYKSCEVRPAPHFCYILDIPPTSRCFKSRHHKRHFDLTYVAQVISHVAARHGTLKREEVTLSFDMTEEQVRKAMHDSVHPKDRKLDGLHYFPVDLPARVHAALKVFLPIAQSTQTRGA